jgi:lactose/L-arabinose transport system substrate-binding protein
MTDPDGNDPGLSIDLEQKLSRRTVLKGAAAGAGALLVSRAAPAFAKPSFYAKKPPSGEITIWDRQGDLFKVFDSTIASFNRKYPHIKVNHVAIDINSKLPTTLASGVGVPDGAFYDDVLLPTLADHFHDITPWIHPYVSDIIPFKVQVNTHHGRITGIPFDLDPGLLYYRADLLEQASIDPNGIKTYDDLLNAARALKEKFGPNTQPIHLEQVPFLGQLWVEMLANQLGTSMVDKNGKLQLRSGKYLKIMRWINQVAAEGLGTRAQYFSPTDLQSLENGNQVFVPWAIWWIYAPQFLLKQTAGKWRAMLLPAWSKTGRRSGVMGGASFVIPQKSKNPYLAWLYYEHLMFDPSGYRAVYGPNSVYPTGLNTSIPSYRKAYAKPLFKNIPELGFENLWKIDTTAGQQVYGNYIVAPWWAQAVDYFGSDIQLVMDQKISPEEALVKASNDITSNLINHP